MIELNVQALVEITTYVRNCKHPERYSATTQKPGGDRWCMACGSARVGGKWLQPSWFDSYDMLLRGDLGSPRS